MTIGRKHFNSIDMRKSNIFLLFAIFSASLFSGCDKAIISPDPESQEEEVCFTAELASPVEIDALTRVAVGSSPSIVWSTGDKIGVFNSSAQSEFTLTEGAGETHGKFNGFIDNGYGNGPFFAYYPYSASVSKAGSKISGLSVPHFQNATAGSYDPAAAPMVAYTVDKTVYFKHVCSFVKITVANNNEDFKYLSRITIKSKNGETIAGTCSATVGTDNSVSVGDYSDDSDMIVLSAPSGSSIAPGTYYIAVLPATLTNGYEVIFDTSKYTYRRILKDGLPARVFERAHVRNLGSFAKDWTWTDVKDQEILYGGDYSNSGGKRIYFSKGNLQAIMGGPTSVKQWRFAQNQYDVIKDASGNAKLKSRAYDFVDGDVVDLFAWQDDAIGATDPLKKYGINNMPAGKTSGQWLYFDNNTKTNSNASSAQCTSWEEAINAGNVHEWSMLSTFEMNWLMGSRSNARGGSFCTITLPDGTTTVVGYWLYPAGSIKWSGSVPTVLDLSTEDGRNTYDEFEAKGTVFIPRGGYISSTNYQAAHARYWSKGVQLTGTSGGGSVYNPTCITNSTVGTAAANCLQNVRLAIVEN